MPAARDAPAGHEVDQRLVALAMTLGRAKATEDPVLTKTLVGEAHGEAQEALVELRNLALVAECII